jgi:4,5-dihydroxyphthalate decarboxylase
MMMRDRGADFLFALPIFPSRPFSHIALRVAKTSPLRDPSELKGKRVGVPDYSMTAAVWARGLLEEEFGVHWSEIEWVTGMTSRFEPPATVRLTRTAADLEDLCVSGEIDALVIPHPREEGRPPSERRLRTLIPDNEAHERRRFGQTGFHPINHCVALSADALTREPDAPRRIFAAYVAAKRRALSRHLGSTLMPWGEARWADMLETFSGDPFPYGLTPANRRVAQTLAALLEAQELVSAAPNLDEIFAPGSSGLTETIAPDA